jgi:hypothetical protein
MRIEQTMVELRKRLIDIKGHEAQLRTHKKAVGGILVSLSQPQLDFIILEFGISVGEVIKFAKLVDQINK